MGNFRDNSRGGFKGRSSGRFGGRSGGFSGGRFGGGRDSERGSFAMHDATCSNCGKRCQVPFKPTGSKPVYCSDCFKQNDGGNFSSRNEDRHVPSVDSSGQFNQINAKLDKIIQILENLEIEVEEDLEDDDMEDDEVEDDSEDDEMDKEDEEMKDYSKTDSDK